MSEGNGKKPQKLPFNGAPLIPGNPGNSGGKKGRSGRPPLPFKEFARTVITSEKVQAKLKQRAEKGDNATLRLLVEQAEGAPEQTVHVDYEARNAVASRVDRIAARVGAAQPPSRINPNGSGG